MAKTTPAAHEPLALRTILVTAQKRVQNILDVPGSVGTMSSHEMTSLHAFRISDLRNYFSDVQLRSDKVVIRGVGSSSAIIGIGNRVGVYIDGVYVGQTGNIDQDLLGISSVEVLRGPQGTLFGANTIAGAVNIITKRPSHTFKGTVSVGVGNFGLQRETAEVSGPLSHGVYGSLAVSSSKDNGYITNVFNNVKFGNIARKAFRAQLDITRIKNLDIYVTADGMQDNNNGTPGRAITDAFGVAPTAYPTSFYQIDSNDIGNNQLRKAAGAMVKVEYFLPNGSTFKSTSAFRYLRLHVSGDADHTPINLLNDSYHYKYNQYSQEFELLSPNTGRLHYLAGFYYYHQGASSTRAAFTGTAAALLGLEPGNGAFTSGTVGTTSYALYGNASYDITPHWVLQAGLRASYETKSAYYEINSSTVPMFQLATGTFRNQITTKQLNPMVTLTYKLRPNTNIYAKFATGYKAGGFNMDFVAANIFPNNITVGPEEVKDYEIGLKTQLFDDRATLNIDAFKENFLGYQLDRYEQTGNGTAASPASTIIVLANAGSVTTQGVEAGGRILAARGLIISGSFAYDNAYFSNYPNAGGLGINYDGHRLTDAPRFTGSVGFNYNHRLPKGYSGNVAMRYSYISRYYNTQNNTGTINLEGTQVPFGYIAGHGLLDASVTVSPMDDTWEISLWARNLTDKQYYSSDFTDFLGVDCVQAAAPRTYGVTFTLNFGDY
jgi:iron complex outermembrane receptor protein